MQFANRSDPHLVQISLKLDSLPQFEKQAKEYQLLPSRREKLLGRRPRNAFVFTEKDLPGYKRRDANRDNSEVSNFHSRSYLYEKNKRDVKKKMSKKRFEPYIRRTLPKQTAIVGAVSRELECTPVEDDEYRELERQKAEQMLKPKEEPQISFNQLKGATYLQPGGVESWVQTKSSKVSRRRTLCPPLALRLASPQWRTHCFTLTINSRSKGKRKRPRIIVPSDFLKMSSSTCYSTYSNITAIGACES